MRVVQSTGAPEGLIQAVLNVGGKIRKHIYRSREKSQNSRMGTIWLLRLMKEEKKMGKRMVVVAVVGLKGGIGKTTTATNMAYLLAKEHDKRVLVVDADCQGNASSVFGVYDPEGSGMAELMCSVMDGVSDGLSIHEFLCGTEYGLDVIPANGYLMQTNGRLMADSEHDQAHVLAGYLEQVQDEYDFCIIDCGLQLDITVANAVLASDMVISPMRVGGFELSAMDSLLTQVDDMRSIKKDIQVVSLLTMFSNNRIHREIEEWFHRQKRFEMFRTHIRNSVVVTKNSLYNGPVSCHSKNSNVVKDYRTVVDELLERLEVV